MNRQRAMRDCVLLVFAGLVLMVSGQAWAQGRVDNSNVLDASNRIGSGGYNATAPRVGSSYSADVFNGNLSGTNARSLVYRPPNSFWGGLPYSPSDVLNQQSAGALLPNGRPAYGQQVPYVSSLYTNINPPAGFTAVPNTGTYAPTPSNVIPQDVRLGANSGTQASYMPYLGEATGPGQVDPTANTLPGYLVATPFYGVQTVPSGQMLNSAYASDLTNGVASSGLQEDLSPSEIVRLRADLARGAAGWRSTPITASDLSGVTPGELGANPNAVVNPGLVNANTGTGSSSQRQNPSRIQPGVAVQASVSGTQALGSTNFAKQAKVASGKTTNANGSVATGQSYRQSLPPLPPPAQQSPEYVQLREKLSQYEAMHPANDEQANDIFQEELRLRRQMAQSAKSSANSRYTGMENPAPEAASPLPEEGTMPSVASAPPPLHIHSIGESIAAPGLGKMIVGGEEMARKEKFREAIARFHDAEAVAPNNLMIAIDLADAELGAGFYDQAEADIRRAFDADPALMMGRFDLNSVISDSRLQVLVTDLKRVATSSNSVTPVFLLAYISFNTGETDKALSYLKFAQLRAGGQDELISSLADHWGAPEEPSTQPSP